jgi:hypothetical protein
MGVKWQLNHPPLQLPLEEQPLLLHDLLRYGGEDNRPLLQMLQLMEMEWCRFHLYLIQLLLSLAPLLLFLQRMPLLFLLLLLIELLLLVAVVTEAVMMGVLFWHQQHPSP